MRGVSHIKQLIKLAKWKPFYKEIADDEVMKKRNICLGFFIIMIFALSLSVYAETKLYEGWLPQYSSIIVNDVNYSITHNSQVKVVSFVSPFESAVVDYESCQTMKYYKYCFITNRTSGYDYDRDREIYEVKVSVSSLLPSIKATSKVTPKDIKLLEDVYVSVALENTGEKPAQNVEYSVEFPLGLVIKRAANDSSNIRISGDRLYWNGVVGPGLTSSFSYVLWPFQGIDETLKANVTYEYEEYNFSTSTDYKIKVEGGSGIETLAEFDEDEVEIGEKARFKINITNEYEDKEVIIKNVIITLSDGLNYLNSYRELEKISNGKYKTNIKLRSEETIGWYMEVEPVFSGKLNVSIEFENLTVNANPLGNLEGKNLTLTVSDFEDIVPSIITSYEKYSSSQFGIVSAFLKNENKDLDFVNVNTVLSSDFDVHKNIISPIIKDGVRLKMAAVNFRAPEVTKTTTYKFYFNGTYQTRYGQEKSFSATKEIEVVPIRKVLEITKTATPSTGLKGGNEILIELWIKNIASERKEDISVFETYPGSFQKVRGKSSETDIALDPEERLKIYDYTLKVPMAISTDQATIDSVIRFQDQGFEFVVHKEVNVSIILPEKPDVTISKVAPLELIKGKYANITYVVENNDDSPATNVVITPFKQKEFDIIGHTQLAVGGVNPNSQKNVTLTIMPKQAGSINVVSDQYVFADAYGNTFPGSINSLDVSVSDGESEGGIIIIDKATDVEQAMINKEFEVKIMVQNVGSSLLNFSLQDNNANWLPSLESQKSKMFNYSFSFTETDTDFGTQAQAEYAHKDKVHYAYSNPVEVAFDPTQPANDTQDDSSGDQDEEQDTDSDDTASEESKGFFSRIFSAIGKFFSNLFG